MPDQHNDKRPHLFLHNTAKPLAFTAHKPNGGASKVVPDLPRQQHGKSLQDQINALKPIATAAVVLQQQQRLESGLGLQIQFVSQPDVELAFESLANGPKKTIMLLLPLTTFSRFRSKLSNSSAVGS